MSVSAFPIRGVFSKGCGATRILVSVSKRRFHNATDRNRAKRQLREAWRLNNSILEETQPLNIAFIWLADTPQPTTLVERKMRNLLHRISEHCSSHPSDSTSDSSPL